MTSESYAHAHTSSLCQRGPATLQDSSPLRDLLADTHLHIVDEQRRLTGIAKISKLGGNRQPVELLHSLAPTLRHSWCDHRAPIHQLDDQKETRAEAERQGRCT